MTTARESLDLIPLCPYCNHGLTEVLARKVTAVGTTSFLFGRRYIYACPNCTKALGISHRKGFWAG